MRRLAFPLFSMTAPLTPPVDILRPLRAASGALHHALDTQLPISRDDASLDDYLAHLRSLRPWLQEIRLALAAPRVDALDRIAARVAERLRALDLDLCDERKAAEPVPPAFLEDASRSAAFAWGLAYVVEGSQLGGAMMRRRLGERFAPHPMRYFSAAGPDGVAVQWREFVRQLGEALHDPATVADAQRGAVAAFERLIARCGLAAPTPAIAA
jgi:heme oxygenase